MDEVSFTASYEGYWKVRRTTKKGITLTCCQVTFEAPVPARSSKLNIDDSVQFLSGRPLSQKKFCNQLEASMNNFFIINFFFIVTLNKIEKGYTKFVAMWDE